MVRIFSGAGKKITEFLAYEPTTDGVFEKLGVSVAAVQVNGGGPREIVTVPLSGRPVIRVFTGEGKRFRKDALSAVVEIDVLDKVAVCPAAAGQGPCLKSDYLEGGYVTGADVDFDGKQEIIFVRGGGGGHERDVEVVAFELDGSQVGHMAKSPLIPFVGGSKNAAVAIIGTDYYQGK